MFQHITVCLDMRGCPNRCRHCWIGHAPNARLPKEALIALAEAFRPFAKRLTVYDWYREPDYGDDYREMWELCGRLSDARPEHFELVSFWRLARDPDYGTWLASLGVRRAQLTLFGGRARTDQYTGRANAFAEILQAVPGKPPLEHLGGDAGHLGPVGQIAGAVGHDAPADLAGQIAGLEQLVAVLDLQGQRGIHGAALQHCDLLRRDGGDGQIVELGVGQGPLLRG